MDISQARKIVEALADGINPITGEVFEKNHCFNEPDIIRALYVAKEQLIKAEKTSTRKQPENAGKPWTPEEDKELKAMCVEGKSIKEIAYYFKRSHGSNIKHADGSSEEKITVYVGFLCTIICNAAMEYYKANKEKFSFLNYEIIDLSSRIKL